MSDSEQWVIHFEAIGDGPPVAIRVRRLLKLARRSLGLRATLIRDPTPAEASNTEADVRTADGVGGRG